MPLKTETIENTVIKTINSWAKDMGFKEKVNINSDLAVEYNLDSLNSIDLILELENKFKISIPNKDTKKLFKTEPGEYGISNIPYFAPVRGIVDYISKKIK